MKRALNLLTVVCSLFLIPAFAMDFQPENNEAVTFSLPEPTKFGREFTPWATNYYVPFATQTTTGAALLDLNGRALGPKITVLDWCKGALEGTIRVLKKDGPTVTYNYAGVGSYEQIACPDPYSKFEGIGKTRFRVSNTEFGEGIKNYLLVPYRSVATATKEFAAGLVIYIPELRGQLITLPNGEQVEHDGYYFTADTGGALNRHADKPGWQLHLDLFTGNDEKPNLTVITNSAEKRFKAYIIQDERIRAMLEAMHKK